MKQAYPKMLPWLAKKSGIPEAAAQKLWIKALRAASAEAKVIESPQYWQAAVDHLRQNLAAEASRRRAAPFGWGSLISLPGRQWFHAVCATEALLAIVIKTGGAWQRRSCH